MRRPKSVLPKMIMKANKVRCGRKLSLYGWPVVFRYPNASLSLGDDCTINSSFLSNLIGMYQRTIIVARGSGTISIGNQCGISGSTIYARNQIIIEDRTLIGANTKILDNDFHPLEASYRMINEESQIQSRPIHIGHDCFIGCNCIILKGTVIGDNCVVGAGSVVHGVFPDNCVIAGNPAKIVRQN